MKNYSEIINSLNSKLYRSGLYYRGNEFNTVDAERYDTSAVKVLICRLSTYRDSTQSFAHTLLYKHISSIEGYFADLAYLPPPSDLQLFRNNSVPSLLATKTKTGPLSFDIIAFSNSLVQELLNLSRLLTESGIRPDFTTRINDKNQPLVILGGSNSSNNHFILNSESPVDVIFTGEDPENIISFFSKIKKLKMSGFKKIDIVKELFREYPVAVPGMGESGIKNVISDSYRKLIQPSGVPLLFKDDPHSSSLVISRGCPWFCSFCNESLRSKPYSEISPEEIKSAAIDIKKMNGSSDVSLFSYNFNAHSKIEGILKELHSRFRIVSLMSQRFDILSYKAEFLKLLQYAGKTSITCGLEGISGRLRRYLSKDLTDEELFGSLNSLLNSPVRTLKIFIIATGLENEDDHKNFDDLLSFINEKLKLKVKAPRIVFSLTYLVRFPGTPQGFEKAYPVSVMQTISDIIGKKVTGAGFEFRISNQVYEYWVSQVLLRNSSGNFFEVVNKTIYETGFVYYNAIDKKFYDRLFLNLKKIYPDPDDLLNRGLDYTHLNTNIKAEFVDSSAKRALDGNDTRTCYSIKIKNAVCNSCGSCETADQRRSAMNYEKGQGLSVDDLRQIISEHSAGVEIRLPVILKEKCRGLSDGYIGAVLTSAVVRALPEGGENIKRFVRLNSRVRFTSEEMLGADEAVFLCSFNDRDSLLENISSESFIVEFEEYAQGFSEINCSGKELSRMIFTINGPVKEIDTSFMAKFHIKSTVIKAGDGIYEAQVSKDGLKKSQFSKVLINIPRSRVEVHYGEKFDLNGFVKVLCDKYKLKKSEIGIFSSPD